MHPLHKKRIWCEDRPADGEGLLHILDIVKRLPHNVFSRAQRDDSKCALGPGYVEIVP